MYIPDDKIEEIRTSLDVVDVVGDYVRLKRRGSNYFGLCPFHDEKTPSFSVNPSMGIFKCFGCGAGGDVFQFVMRVEALSFPETARLLAERAGVSLPEQDEEREKASEVEAMYHALRFAARFFYRQLTQAETGEAALAYLRKRGVEPATIKKFGLGYAPDSWDALLTAAGEHHIEPEVLEKAGLVLQRRDGSGHYDRFRARVIFPILSHVGKVLGFGGRILAQDSDQPKYINSPETKVYNKSRVLYGLYHGKHAIRKSEEVILVEGYTDVIALHQSGVQNVVASSGTALTREQVKTLGRYAKRVLLLYDADAAGAEAALRGIDLVLEEGLSAYAVALPGGDDPDSYVDAHGGEAFTEYVKKERQDFAAFKYALARRAGALDTPEGEAETMRSILASIVRIPDPLMQETFLRRASEVLSVPDMQLRRVMDDMRKERSRPSRRAPVPRPAPPLPEEESARRTDLSEEAETAPVRDPLPEEKLLIRLMLERGLPLVEFILSHMALDEFSPGPSRTIAEHLLAMYQAGAVETQHFFDGRYGEAVQRLASEVMVDRHEASENWQLRQNIPVPRLNEDPFETASSAMTLLKLDRVNEALKQNQERQFRASQRGEDESEIQAQRMALYDLRKKIERREFLEWDAS